MDPHPVPSAFQNSCDHPTAFVQVHFRWLTCCPIARLSQLSLCPDLLTKARTPVRILFLAQEREYCTIIRMKRSRGCVKKNFKGEIHPSTCAKPLILLGLLYTYMHEPRTDDKKILKNFSQKSKSALLLYTRNRSAEDDASVRATSLTDRMYASDDSR